MFDHRVIAAAQTVPTRGDVEANVAEHARLAAAAADEGVQVLVFPELSLTGYELDLADELAFTEQDARLDPLLELASRAGMIIVAGAPVRLTSGLHISAFVLSPDPSVKLYTKHHLGAFPADANPGGSVPPAEATVFGPGDHNPLVKLDDHHTAAIAVCADTGRASHPAAAAERGADTYLASMFVIPADLEEEAARFADDATCHAMAIVMANFGGPTGGLPSAGRSAVWSQQGALVARLEPHGTGLAIGHEEDGSWQGKALMLPGRGCRSSSARRHVP